MSEAGDHEPPASADRRTLPIGFSTYLDLLRFLAAFAVYCEHFSMAQSNWQYPLTNYGIGHAAVVVFFVLSGYVILFVADTREKTISLFAASRLARILSVAIPALLLTAAIDVALLNFGYADQVRAYQLMSPWKYVPIFLLFATDFWFLNEQAFSNAPFWSLSYEVWYYVAFAVAFYFGRRSITRKYLLAVIAAIVGPRLWILFPIWLIGAMSYRAHGLENLNHFGLSRRAVALSVFVISAAAFCLFVWLGFAEQLSVFVDMAVGRIPSKFLRGSQFFVTDYVLGALVAVNILAARYCEFNFKFARSAIVFFADNSFTLYLFHYPLLEFFRLILQINGQWLFAITLITALIFGSIIEPRKTALRKGLLALCEIHRFGRNKWVLTQRLGR